MTKFNGDQILIAILMVYIFFLGALGGGGKEGLFYF